MNHLYCGDNLKVLRDSIRDESVDLIYLDPPFNSNASYNVLFKGPAGNESAAMSDAEDRLSESTGLRYRRLQSDTDRAHG